MRRFLLARSAEWLACILCLAIILVVPSLCFAGDTSVGVGPIDSLSKMIVTSAKGWIAPLQGYARGVFLGLAVIQLGWIGIRHSLSGEPQVGSAVGAIALEFVTLGFFALLIDRGPGWAEDIINSLQEAGRVASGGGHGVKPQEVLNEMVKLSTNVLEELSLLNGLGSGFAMSIGCLALLFMTALIAGLMLIGWVQAWVVVGAGSILLGFGGSVWTRSLATGYLRHAVGAGVKLMVLELLQSLMLGHVKAWVDAAHGGDTFDLELLTTVLVSTVIMVVMIATIPAYVSSIVTGAVMNGGEAALTRAAAAMAMVGIGMGLSGASAKSSGTAGAGAGSGAQGIAGSTLAPGLVGPGASAGAPAAARLSGLSLKGTPSSAGAESSATGEGASGPTASSPTSGPAPTAGAASAGSGKTTAAASGHAGTGMASAKGDGGSTEGGATVGKAKGKGAAGHGNHATRRLPGFSGTAEQVAAADADADCEAGSGAASSYTKPASVPSSGASSQPAARASSLAGAAEASGGSSPSPGAASARPAEAVGGSSSASATQSSGGALMSGARKSAGSGAAGVGDGLGASSLPMGGFTTRAPVGKPAPKPGAARLSNAPRHVGPTRLETALASEQPEGSHDE